MKNIFLYTHGGSANHGCEALVRSTIKILSPNIVTIYSKNPQEDVLYGLNQQLIVLNEGNKLVLYSPIHFKLKILSVLSRKDDCYHFRTYKNILSNLTSSDIYIYWR